MIKNKNDLINISMLEASVYLKISMKELIDYTLKGLLKPRIQLREKHFSKNELMRFRREVLEVTNGD